jgi:hypothetical protein
MTCIEFEFVAWFNDNDNVKIIPVDDFDDTTILGAVRQQLFAEINIPYRPDLDTTICYTFHIFNLAHHEIALDEAVFLQDIITDIHRDFGERIRAKGDNHE